MKIKAIKAEVTMRYAWEGEKDEKLGYATSEGKQRQATLLSVKGLLNATLMIGKFEST